MKASDYLVEFLISKGIGCVFGYPGGMVTHIMDSLSKYNSEISAYLFYNEQGAALAACGYAQTTHRPGVAYATSGPGATNLVTGIANAYFDSIPTIFFTGQVNTYESRGKLGVRQRGFQEMDVVEMVRGVTKYAAQVNDANQLPGELEKAYALAMEGRPGPVVLDIPMDVQRTEIDPVQIPGGGINHGAPPKPELSQALELVRTAKRPCLLLGAGVRTANRVKQVRQAIAGKGLSVVSSMIAVDVLPRDDPNYFGFVGAYGGRTANFIVNKCDLLISVGSRLDCRQTGTFPDGFAQNAQLLRFDIDPGELSNRILPNEMQYICDIDTAIEFLEAIPAGDWEEWRGVCKQLSDTFSTMDESAPTRLMQEIGACVPDGVTITTDVGQNQVWTAQAFPVKDNQTVLFSGGHGAMGYSLPAAIGAHLGTGKQVVSINGDGGIQMNLQELQTVAQNRFPVKIVVFHNHALGMIRHFQEMYFEENYTQTVENQGFSAPNFQKLATAFDIPYHRYSGNTKLLSELFHSDGPVFIEVEIHEPTYVLPKLAMGKPNHDQDPLMPRELLTRLMEL